jgi:hypothetical protein
VPCGVYADISTDSIDRLLERGCGDCGGVAKLAHGV